MRSRNGSAEDGFDETFPPVAGPLPKERRASPTSMCGLSWSTAVLMVVLALVYIIIWTLPAPTMWSKVTLLRQSWHLSEVLKEPPVLQHRLTEAEKELQQLRAKVAEVKGRNDAVQARVDVAEGAKKDLRKQLSKIQNEVVKLQSERVQLTKKLEEEKKRRAELSAKWKRLKESELPLLNSIPDTDA